MEKVEIITPETKSDLEQPEKSGSSSLMLKEISPLDTIYQWNPMGIRVVLNLPVIGDDQSYLFFIACSPYIPHITNDFYAFGLTNAIRIYGSRVPVFHNPGANLIFSENIIIVQHSPPPLISDIARSCRYWKGSLKYRLRAVASFLNQGYLAATPIYGVKRRRLLNNPFVNRQSFIRPDERSYLGSQANSYVMADASMSRHLEVEVDYRHIVPLIDLQADLASQFFFTPVNNTANFTRPSSTPHDETLLGIQLRGELPSNGTTNQMAFEIEMCAGENFQVSGESVYFHPCTRLEQTIKTTYYADNNTTNTPLPLVYSTPDSLPNELSKWSGRIFDTTAPTGTSLRYTPG